MQSILSRFPPKPLRASDVIDVEKCFLLNVEQEKDAVILTERCTETLNLPLDVKEK